MTVRLVPINPVSTGGLLAWAFSSVLTKKSKEWPEAFIDDCAYCLDAPSHMPSGSHCHHLLHDKGHRNFLERG